MTQREEFFYNVDEALNRIQELKKTAVYVVPIPEKTGKGFMIDYLINEG
jgi:hypothetical protein